MSEVSTLVYRKLDELGVSYEAVEHPPVQTIEDCAAADRMLGAVTVKNYFLTTKNRKNFYLCLVRPNARFRTSDISRQVNSSRLSFGPEDKLEELLRVRPGAVSPMGLIFDGEKQVRLIVDSAIPTLGKVAFHPCDNTKTLAMSAGDFFGRFLPAVDHEPLFVEIHDFEP